MATDFDKFLEPVAGENPAGQDLDESGEIFSLDQAVGWPQSLPTPWQDVQDRVEEALTRSRDIRLGVTLAVAALNTEGVEAFARGVGLLRAMLEKFWDGLYPAIEEDGNAEARRNALINLSSFYKVIRPLHRCWLVDQKGIGRFSALDIDIAEGRIEPPEGYPPELPQMSVIEAAFAATDTEVLSKQLSVFTDISSDLGAIRESFETRVPDAGAPDLERLMELVDRCQAIVRARLPAEAEQEEAEPGDQESAGGGASSGPANSRREALLAIERAARYFRSAEPSSPVPLLLDRAVRLAEADFLTIVQDLAPDALVQARMLRGSSEQEET